MFRNAAAILPANQGMHFGVFVDRLVDDQEQAARARRVCARAGRRSSVDVSVVRRGSARVRSTRRLQLDRPSAPPPNKHFRASYRNKVWIEAAAANV